MISQGPDVVSAGNTKILADGRDQVEADRRMLGARRHAGDVGQRQRPLRRRERAFVRIPLEYFATSFLPAATTTRSLSVAAASRSGNAGFLDGDPPAALLELRHPARIFIRDRRFALADPAYRSSRSRCCPTRPVPHREVDRGDRWAFCLPEREAKLALGLQRTVEHALARQHRGRRGCRRRCGLDHVHVVAVALQPERQLQPGLAAADDGDRSLLMARGLPGRLVSPSAAGSRGRPSGPIAE